MADLKDAIEGIKKTIEDAVASGDLIPRADAKAAQALVVERFRHDLQFMVDSIAEDKAYVADKYPALFKTIQARLAEMGTFGGVQVFGEIARDLLVLAPADGLAAVEALRVEARENAMQALASMGQAQEAYEAQLEAEAELARVKADAAAAQALVVEQCAKGADRRYAAGDMGNPGHHIRALAPADGLAMVQELRAEMDSLAYSMGRAASERDTLAAENASLKAREKVDANLLLAAYKGLLVLHRMLSKSGLSVGAETATYITDQIAAAHPEMPGLASLRAAPTDPGDGWTWNERLGWIGPDGKPADPRRRG